MEEQILRYYLKVFSIILFFFIFFLFFYIFYILNKNIIFKESLFNIKKGERIDNVLKINTINLSIIDIYIIKKYYQVNKIIFNDFVHYGDFYIQRNITALNFIKIITKSSNVLNKITIIEGWSSKELERELSKYFDKFYSIPYNDIIADTYFFEKNKDFDYFVKNLKKIKNQFFIKHQSNNLLKIFNEDDIMIIGSLIEKEGLDNIDKSNISSVIFNRLNKNMKLQIDASVIYAITNGQYKFDRKLLYSDLKINNPFNTYKHYGLPPTPIAYTGKKTLEIIFENKKTDFLFYFFNNSLNRHIFSNNYNDHINRLNEYRNKK